MHLLMEGCLLFRRVLRPRLLLVVEEFLTRLFRQRSQEALMTLVGRCLVLGALAFRFLATEVSEAGRHRAPGVRGNSASLEA